MKLVYVASAAILAVGACSDQQSADPVSPPQTEALLGQKLSGCPFPEERQILIAGIRADIGELFVGGGDRRAANAHIENIERKLCEEKFEDALNMAWGFLGLVTEKEISGHFAGDEHDAAELASDVFALVAADPNSPSFHIPPGAFEETGGVLTFDPSNATPESPIVASTQNNEAAVVIDDPNVFPPGTGPVTIVLARAPGDLVIASGAYIPSFQAYEEGYEILSSHQPWSEGPGALIAVCGVPPLPTDAVIGHLHEQSVSLLIPTHPDPQELGYIDCSDVESTTSGGGVELIGMSEYPHWASKWMGLARHLAEPLANWLSPPLLNAETIGMGLAGPGLGGRTRSLSSNAPVDPVIDVGESIQLSAGPTASWNSDNEDVATVDANGVVTGVGAGTAMITAHFGGESLSMPINVGGPGGGNLIAYARIILPLPENNAEIFVMNPDGTGETNLTNNSAYDSWPEWSPDGTRIAFSSDRTGSGRVYIMNADGSGLSGPFGQHHARSPSWSPDGTRIAYAAPPPDGTRPDWMWPVYIMNIDGTNDRELSQSPPGITDLDWSPDGTRLAVVADQPWFPDDRLMVVNTDGTGVATVVTSFLLLANPKWSPDGTRILFSRTDFNSNGFQIHVMNSDGTDVVNLSGSALGEHSASWSPDGSQIVFRGRVPFSSSQIYVMNADGTGRTAITGDGVYFGTDWRP